MRYYQMQSKNDRSFEARKEAMQNECMISSIIEDFDDGEYHDDFNDDPWSTTPYVQDER